MSSVVSSPIKILGIEIGTDEKVAIKIVSFIYYTGKERT